MKRLYLILFSLCTFLGYSQDYILNENFDEDNRTKLRLPFEPDWSRDFFIETKVQIVTTLTPNSEQAGLLFGYDEDTDSYYGLSIQNSSSNLNTYADYYRISSNNTTSFIENNDEWQLTSIINHSAYNRIQFYKIDNELYFSINDQVVAYVPEINTKGKELRIITGKTGIYCAYIHAYYLNNVDKQALKNNLKKQLNTYSSSKIHHKIANDYPKVEALKSPEKIPSSAYGYNVYLPEYDAVSVGTNFYDIKTFNLLSSEDVDKRIKNTVIRNNVNRHTEILIPNQPKLVLEGYNYIDWLNDEDILLLDRKERIYTYNINTKTLKKRFKADYGATNLLSNNKRYLCLDRHVYDMQTGKEIKITGRGNKILSCFDEYVILEVDLFATYKINIKTGEKEHVSNKGTYQDHYFIEVNGRELTITDLLTDKKVVTNLQLLVQSNRKNGKYRFAYFPERNEVYVNDYSSILPLFYFSYDDEIKNTSSFIVNTETNEITPLLLYKTSTEVNKNEEALQATRAKGKQEVEQFLSQFKTFGSSYTLNYNNYDYVNISSDPLMNKHGVGGITHAIGKFCTYNGGSILALGISNNQYTVELITVTYSVFGVHVKREKLGFTQIKNGFATQIANVNVRRDSSDPTKYTLTVNDGKTKQVNLISNCN